MTARCPARLFRASLLALVVGLTLPISVAFAEALVIVEVATPSGEPANGTVTLVPKSGEGETFSCVTDEGTCRIADVPGGLYTATLTQGEDSEGPDPHTVMIPPSGRVTLHVATE